MKVLTRDELRDMARPTHQKMAQAEEKARAEIAAATFLRTAISPIVPIDLWISPGLRANIGIRTLPLVLENALDLMDAHPPITTTQLANGSAKPTASLTDRDREGSYRNVAPFYMRAQYDVYRHPQGTDARLCWWSYLMDEEMLVHFEMPLADVENYLICRYATKTRRSKQVRFNDARTRLLNAQVQRYSGGDRDAPSYFYFYWDMKTTIRNVIDGMQEDWHEF